MISSSLLESVILGSEESRENPMQHTIQLTLEDAVIQERDVAELQHSLRLGLILLDYVTAKISIGRFAELLGLDYERAREWLHRCGIPTLRKLSDPDLEAACKANYRDLAGELGISLPSD